MELSFTGHGLVWAVVVWPLAAALAAAVLARAGLRGPGFDAFVVAAAGATLAGVSMLVPPVVSSGRVSAALPGLLGRVEFSADAFGLVFALVGAFVWFCATLYATAYLRRDPGRVRFQVTSLVLLSANLGVVLAADWPTLYVSFEVLGLVALILVVHDGSEKARRAGVKYFWLTLSGGVALLAGIFMVAAATGSTAIAAGAPVAAGAGWAAFGLMLAGFGVKAGMVPLHVWLPDAHPVAPPPASALLSGVMIKAGAYGIFRMLELVAGPADGATAPGVVVLWFGLATGLVGVVLALGQHQAKRMLAWHSVSQMGFVLTGLGAGAVLAAEGAMGTAGGLLHVVNHGLFKACLFLGAGAVALRAGTADMYRLGGLWRRMPVTFACMLIAAAGIAGVPLFNGFVSKSMIHHALVDAAGSSAAVPGWTEGLFLLVAAGTMASFIKLTWLVFLRPPGDDGPGPVSEAPPAMLAGMGVLAVPIVLIGLRPGWILEGLMVPGLAGGPVAAEPVAYYLSRYFLSSGDLWSFAGVAAGGAVIFLAGMRFGLFHLHAPAWVGVDYWYRRGGAGLVKVCRDYGSAAAAWRAAGARRLSRGLRQVDRALSGPPKIRARVRHRLRRAAQQLRMGLALPAQWKQRISWVLLAPPGQRRVENARYRRLDALRDRIVTRAGSEAGDPRRLDGTRLVAGLLATRLIDQAMSAFRAQPDKSRVREWIADVETREAEIARLAVELAGSWLGGAEISEEEFERAVRRAGGGLFPSAEEAAAPPAAEPVPRAWVAELKEMLLRPAERHWPVTESLDRGALVAVLRARLERIARNLSVALVLVFALLGLVLALVM